MRTHQASEESGGEERWFRGAEKKREVRDFRFDRIFDRATVISREASLGSELVVSNAWQDWDSDFEFRIVFGTLTLNFEREAQAAHRIPQHHNPSSAFVPMTMTVTVTVTVTLTLAVTLTLTLTLTLVGLGGS